MNLQIMLFGVAAAVAVLLGGLLIVSRKSWPERFQEVLLALGAGFILALVFLKLIPASFDAIGTRAAWFIMGGYAVIHFFEHTIIGHFHFGEETHAHVMVSNAAGVSAFTGLFIHSFFDGLSISVGMQFDFFLGLLVFVAVLLHKFPEGLTIGSIMLTAGYDRRSVLLGAGGIGLATMIGTSTVYLFDSVSAEVMGMAFAFSAGTVVYVGASDLIPEINKTDSRLPPLLVLAGMALFYVSEVLLESFVG